VVAEDAGELEAAADWLAEAAERWTEYGFVLEPGHALLRRGRCLLRLGAPSEGLASVAAAREVFCELGADPLPTLRLVSQAS